MQEIQVDKLLAKAQSLKSITEDPLAKKVLEIEMNADSSKNKDLLTRLIRSLDQYVNKQESLVYIGFVGHYSSGKSSTINNLLDLNGTIDQRSVGLNPTDKAITLITNTKNSNGLILMNRESNLVPVRTILLHHNHLNNLVIADTPGSGDPQVVNEMIQDFLPICDYILYFISAANPMDQADLPLLQQKTHKLPFIPIVFVITRTDEFRINKVKSIDDTNIDRTKKDQFIGQLISRIKEIIKTDTISVNDFIFIDNEFTYGIDTLKERIDTWSSNIDKEGFVRIHGYKVEYYRTNLNEIYSYFITIIEEKIRKSKDFLRTANENIQRFDKSIELNNEKLKVLWTKSDITFKENLSEEKKILSDIGLSLNPSNVEYGENAQLEKKLIKKNIDDLVNGYLGKIVLDLNNHFKQRIRDVKQNVITNINEGNILMENISHLFPGRIDFDKSNQTLDIDFSKLNDFCKTYQRSLWDLLYEARNILKSRIGQFRGLISKESLIKSVITLYEQGKKNINENFDQYFEKIQMYRSTVLTRNTKETIEKLRIGTQLDELDDEFSDEFITEMKDKAVHEVYFSNEDAITELQRSNETLISDLIAFKKDIENISISPDIENQQFGKETIDISNFLNSLINQSQIEINKSYQERLNSALDKHITNYNAYLKSVELSRKKRKKKIINWSLIVGFLTVLIYAGLRFSNVIKPPTLLFDIVIALATTGLGNFIGYAFSMLKLDVRKLTSINKEQFLKQERIELLKQFNEDFWEELSKKASEPRSDINSSFLKNLFSQKIELSLSNIISKNQLVMDELQNANKKLIDFINGYRSKVEVFHSKHSSIFQNIDKNIHEIELITKHIKETAIKPSFDLLIETTDNLEMVKAKIKGV